MLPVMLRRCFSLCWVVGLLGIVACSSEPTQEVKRNGPPFTVANKYVRLRILSDGPIDTVRALKQKLNERAFPWEGEDRALKVALYGLQDSAVSVFLYDSVFADTEVYKNPQAYFVKPLNSWVHPQGLIACHFNREPKEWWGKTAKGQKPVVFYLFYDSSFERRDHYEHEMHNLEARRHDRWVRPNQSTDSLLMKLWYRGDGIRSYEAHSLFFIIAIDSATRKHTYAPARSWDKY